MAETVRRGSLEVMDLSALGVDALVTTRQGGVSLPPYDSLNLGLHVGDIDVAVVNNRAVLARALDVELDDLVFMDQVHGTRVALVGEDERGRGARSIDNALVGTDAMVTTTTDLPLVVLVADCAPVVLVDEVAGVLGVAHAGWRGLVGGVLESTLSAMAGLGAEPGRTAAAIGPCVDVDRYEVGDEVVDTVLARLGDAGEHALDRTRGARAHLDVSKACALDLEALGLTSALIARSSTSTADPRLFSDRAMRPCGRFAVVARLRPSAR